MAKGRNWRGDGQPLTDAAMGGPGARHMTHLEVHRDGEGKYLVSHHYENSGEEGIGHDYREKPHKLATAAAMGAHVMKHAESIRPSGAKDERPEEDEYDNEGGNENER